LACKKTDLYKKKIIFELNIQLHTYNNIHYHNSIEDNVTFILHVISYM